MDLKSLTLPGASEVQHLVVTDAVKRRALTEGPAGIYQPSEVCTLVDLTLTDALHS